MNKCGVRFIYAVQPLPGTVYRRYVLMFSPESFRSLEESLGYRFMRYYDESPGYSIPRLRLSRAQQAEVIGMFRRIDPLYGREDEESQALIRLIIAELLIRVNKLYDFYSWDSGRPPAPAGAEDQRGNMMEHEDGRERIEGIKVFIRENLDRKLTIGEIADRFYISQYYLSHYFRRETGFCISQYTTQQKMIAAKQMLQSGVSIMKVTMALGYNSESHFITTFQKWNGITPKQYLLSLRDPENT